MNGRNPRALLTIAFFLGLALFIAGYAYEKTKNLLEGPVITITAPENGAELRDPLVTVEGTTRNISKITLNGRPISIDQTSGAFREAIVMPLGYTIVSIVGEDRFGKRKEVTLQLVRQEERETVQAGSE